MTKHTRTGPAPSIYGYHAVRAAWLNPARTIEALYITDAALNGFKPALKDAQKTGLKRPAPSKTHKKELDKMLPAGAVHQGLALSCTDLPELVAKDLLIQSRDKSESVLLMLDQITDPHNVGAILRSASAFGADGIIMQRRHAPDLTGALAKAASGAVEHVPVAAETNLSRALEELKEGGYFAFGLDERGKDIGSLKPGGKTVLVLGAEGPGLRRLVAKNCDELLRLPTTGPIKSLNVSNAAAVALYALKD